MKIKNAKQTIRAVVMTVAVLAVSGSAQERLWLSRYWDGCKPTCSWAQNVDRDMPHGLCKACDINDNELPLGEIAEAVSSCEGGNAYTCWDQIPFADKDDPNLAYGFGATNTARCGDCFEVIFDGTSRYDDRETHAALLGKRLILMARNTGSDVAPDQIDFMVPGGGLGMFDSFSEQLGFPHNAPQLGAIHGGLLTDCERSFPNHGDGTPLAEWQSCLREKCNGVFSNPAHAILLEGCLFYADWMMAASNPMATVTIVECPQVLIDRYKPASGAYTIMRKAIYLALFTSY